MASKVYFIKGSCSDGEKLISKKARTLFKAGGFANCFRENDFTAVKVHVGEAGNTTYITPPCIRGLIDELLKLKTKPFLTDTSALYVGRRHNAIEHAVLAAEHGFCEAVLGIPFIVPDGLFGTSETPVKINGELNKEVFIASDIARSQSILSVAHFTGHCAACMGATLKTLGMGCASRKGKMRQHAALTLSIGDDCTRCGQCYDHCPADAITLNDVKAHIDQDKCIGCAECLVACGFNAVECDWGEEDEVLQKNIAEHALGTLEGKQNKSVFFNYLISVTKDCDCFSVPDMPGIVDDIGILASTDPVAVDKAALDMVEAKGGKKLAKLIGYDKLNPHYQLEHAQRIGLGTADYDLVNVD
ncbi:MAG: DUF362 domain-containing protein [Planctomycetota bacterium]|nr:MAG: DUF362 domain-containing protein [Planctomycetota bacterium]